MDGSQLCVRFHLLDLALAWHVDIASGTLCSVVAQQGLITPPVGGLGDKEEVQCAQLLAFPTAQVESLVFWNTHVPRKPRMGLGARGMEASGNPRGRG